MMKPHDTRANEELLFSQRVADVLPELRRRIARFARGDSDIEDKLAQTVTIRLWEKRALCRGTGSQVGWATTVCDRVCSNSVRQVDRLGKRVPLSEELAANAAFVEPDSAVVAQELSGEAYLDSVADAVAGLPPRKRAIAIAHWYMGKKASRIATEFGLRVSSVWTALSQAKSALRAALQLPSGPGPARRQSQAVSSPAN